MSEELFPSIACTPNKMMEKITCTSNHSKTCTPASVMVMIASYSKVVCWKSG